jgi:hypothetical protein
MTETNRLRTRYKYRCKVCGWSCTKEHIPGVSVPITKLGDYGSKGTPTGVTFADELYKATTVRFVAATGTAPAYLADSANLFGDKLLKSEMPIRIATSSGTNDGDYTIAARGVSRGEITLKSTDVLTTESAATAGTVTISKIGWKPNQAAGGCPSCHSLASR